MAAVLEKIDYEVTGLGGDACFEGYLSWGCHLESWIEVGYKEAKGDIHLNIIACDVVLSEIFNCTAVSSLLQGGFGEEFKCCSHWRLG